MHKYSSMFCLAVRLVTLTPGAYPIP